MAALRVFHVKRECVKVASQLNGDLLFDGTVTAIERININGISSINMAKWFSLEGDKFLASSILVRAALRFSQNNFSVPIYQSDNNNSIEYSPRLWSVLLLKIDDLSGNV